MAAEKSITWRKAPAHVEQLAFLARFGYPLEGRLTRGRASDLIVEIVDDAARWELVIPDKPAGKVNPQARKCKAYRAHEDCTAAIEKLRNANLDEMGTAKAALALALKKRLQFWRQRFRDFWAGDAYADWIQATDLYSNYGRRFKLPTAEQITRVLSALDEKRPNWDRDYPQLFFETLELNYPELIRPA
jgi:hypothetical protein